MKSGASTPTGYTYAGTYGTSYYYLSQIKTDWISSKIKAESAGGHMVVINSADEFNYLTSIKTKLTTSESSYGTFSKSWVGLYQELN